jgi:hypothetical protein
MFIITCPFYSEDFCKLRRRYRSCIGKYNLKKLFSDIRGGCGDLGDEDREEYISEVKEFRCIECNRKVTEEEFFELGGLCKRCRGMPTQHGFPKPPGFPKP